jgi:hypothetical protein
MIGVATKDATFENELLKFELLKHINDKGYRRFKVDVSQENPISLLVFLELGGSIFSSLFSGTLGLSSSHKVELGVLGTDGFELSLLVEISDEGSGNGSVDLELLAEDGAGDAKDLWDFVAEFLVSSFVKEDLVVKLILDLHLGPRLLLGFTASLLGSGKSSLFVLAFAGVFTGG